MLAGWQPADGEREYALEIDRERPRRLLIVPALFDEANKMRRFTVEVMRACDVGGVDAILPDLPGCNESTAPLTGQTIAGWREAVATVAAGFRATETLAIRGGALIAPPGLPGWTYAPVAGASLLRGLLRARVLSSKEAGTPETREQLLETGMEQGLELAGYRLGAAMIGELQDAAPVAGEAIRTIAQGDLGGPGLWLRAEPDHDRAQAEALAAIVIRGHTA